MTETRLSKNDPRHGTTTGYTYYACRCEACRAASTAAMRAARATNPARLDRDRRQQLAYHHAEQRLRETHREEFEVLYAEERARVGLPPNDGSRA